MGGGGGGGYFPSNPERLKRLIQDARGTEAQQKLDSEVNELLQDSLATFNERNAEKVQDHLEKIALILGKEFELDQFRFGGSVAKHTYVDGLSDIDALVILGKKDIAGESPKEVLDSFHDLLSKRLTSDDVADVEKGRMAVTVTYRDGTEIQLLPTLRFGSRVAIPNASKNDWKETNPKAFQKELTRVNERLNGRLVPSIKLVKSIVANLPEQQRLSGYHTEALCLESMAGYRGASSVKDLVLHALDYSAKRVLRPVGDVTGQSRAIDSDLGKANSIERRVVADALAGVARRLNAATTVEEWKRMLDV